MSAEKRAEAQEAAKVKAQKAGTDPKQEEFDAALAASPELAELYQETYSKIKLDKEYDINKLNQVADRFNYFANDKNMRNKIKDKRYDLPGHKEDTEDEAFSTDFDIDVNPADTQLYHHYRLMQMRQKEDMAAIEEKLTKLNALAENKKLGLTNRRDDK